jgi:hypothetical protein
VNADIVIDLHWLGHDTGLDAHGFKLSMRDALLARAVMRAGFPLLWAAIY